MTIRYERIIENGGAFTDYEFRMLCRIFDFRCAKCGKEDLLHADHIKPVSWGGHSKIDNIQPLCQSCNLKKSNNECIDYRESFYGRFIPLKHHINHARKNFIIAIFLENYGEGYANNLISLWLETKGVF